MKKNQNRAGATRVIRKVADATDSVLIRAGEAARKRSRARHAKSGWRTAGKVALVLGAGAATAYAGRTVLARVNARTRGRGSSKRK
ncbi:MAG: hypothetical protein ACT4PM_15340 [Gemmatimonadales bacterium]